MINYFYCRECSELIHKDNISEFDDKAACGYCRQDVEHSEDFEEGDEGYETVKELEKLQVIKNKLMKESAANKL